MKIAIDVVLLPPEEVMGEAIRINKKLGPEIKLNKENCVPHISLCMGILEEEKLPEVKKILQEIVPSFLPMELTEGEIKIYQIPNGNKCPCLYFKNTEELQKLHGTIMKKLSHLLTSDGTKKSLYNPEEVDELTLNWLNNYHLRLDNPSSFDPHITLGVGELENLDFPIIKFSSNRLAVFQLGNYCTCRRKLIEF